MEREGVRVGVYVEVNVPRVCARMHMWGSWVIQHTQYRGMCIGPCTPG